MELSKLLLKVLYLIIIYTICYVVLQSQTSLMNMNVMVLTLFISVLIMYISFEYVYQFLIHSEVIFKTTNKDSDKKEQSAKGNRRSRTEVEKTVHVANKQINDYVLDHTHKYIQDGVFSA